MLTYRNRPGIPQPPGGGLPDGTPVDPDVLLRASRLPDGGVVVAHWTGRADPVALTIDNFYPSAARELVWPAAASTHDAEYPHTAFADSLNPPCYWGAFTGTHPAQLHRWPHERIVWGRLADRRTQDRLNQSGSWSNDYTRAHAEHWVPLTYVPGNEYLRLADLKESWALCAGMITAWWTAAPMDLTGCETVAGIAPTSTGDLPLFMNVDARLRSGDLACFGDDQPRSVAEFAESTVPVGHRRVNAEDEYYITPEMFHYGPGVVALWPEYVARLSVWPLVSGPTLTWAPRGTVLEPGCSTPGMYQPGDQVYVEDLKAAVVAYRRTYPDESYTPPKAPFRRTVSRLGSSQGYITPKMFVPSPDRDAFFAWVDAQYNAPLHPATADLRFGFELETQLSQGLRYKDKLSATLDQARDAVHAQPTQWLRTLLSLGVSAPLDCTVADVLTANLNLVQRQLSTKPARDVIAERLTRDGRTDLEAKADGSVSGFEFVTADGGLPRDEALAVARYILDPSWNHVIDAGCSFHIHVSAPPHASWRNAGTKFQTACLEYLAVHLDEVPAAVRDRWANIAKREQYFKLVSSTADRYAFVAWRGITWEFRCWGNVSTPDDAAKCLDLTERAFRYALARVQGARSLTPRVSFATVAAALNTLTPLPQRGAASLATDAEPTPALGA